MNTLNFITVSTFMIIIFSKILNTLQTYECVEMSFSKKKNKMLNELIIKKSFYLPSGCHFKTSISGKVKGNIRNE